jgi:hypothetical protein
MKMPPKSVCEKIRKAYLLLGSDKEGEAENARKKILALLAKHGCTWNDLEEILRALREDEASQQTNQPPPPGQPTSYPKDQPNPYNLARRLIEIHVFVEPAECTAMALWVLHAAAFRQFEHTPRLALVSPVRGCGKTTCLKLLELLIDDALRVDDITPAAIYRQSHLPVFLLDEFDNANLRRNLVLKSVLHPSGVPAEYAEQFQECASPNTVSLLPMSPF